VQWLSSTGRRPARRPRFLTGRRGLLVAVVVVLSAATVATFAVRSTSGHPPRGRSSIGNSPNPLATSSASAGPAGSFAPSVPAPAPSGDGCVAATLSRLTLEDKVGQLLMIGTPIANPTSIVAAVRRYRLGGVFLAGRSSQSAATVRQNIQAIQQAATASIGIPVQVALDQEGGLVQTLSGNDFPPFPSAVQQSNWDTARLRSSTGDWAHRLAAAAVTMDLAPVADTVPAGTAASNPPIGELDRQYGSTPDAVARHIATVVGAAQSAGIMTTLKHFPGLGRVRANTDTSTRAVDAMMTADDPYLRPFIEGIRAGSGAVMVSSALYPQLDSQSVAAFSAPVITGLLRQRLGFTGVVVSDDLGAAVAVGSVPVGERAVRFVNAGGDLVLTVRPADAGPMANALLAAAQQSQSFAARVADAAEHVVRSKARVGLLACRTGVSSGQEPLETPA
jgi:beta-N-acetylhexosaminidase